MAGHIPSDLPVYVYIKRVLKNRIEDGELPEGARVPSEMELARQYNVSRNPTRQALRDLEQEGYIVRSPGRGSFVAPISKREKPLRITEWPTLAVACPVLELHYTRQVIQGFTRCAAEKNFHTMVYFQHFSNESEFDFLADIRNSGIDGIAFWLQHPSGLTLDLLEKFHRASFPFVLIDRYARGVEADFVVTDNEDVAYRLTKTLTDRGHRSIGLITTPIDNTTVEDRQRGYRRALEEAGIPYNPALTGITPGEYELLSPVAHRIMAVQGRPTAFLCVNDGLAGKLLDDLDALGYRVPEDVEIATVDDNQLAQVLDMPIIAASQAGYEMGRQSAQILIARVEEPKRPIEKRFLKADLHVPEGLPARTP
jgi:DNA-binding LacI/PurR family transcriptional regulator